MVAIVKVSSAMAPFRRLSSHSLASSPLMEPRLQRRRRKSLDEAEPLEQLSKLDVVLGNGAEQSNQFEPERSHRCRRACIRPKVECVNSPRKRRPSSFFRLSHAH